MNSENENKIFHTREANTIIESPKSTAENTQMPTKRHTPIISFSGKKKRKHFSFRPLILPLVCFFISYLLLLSFVEKNLENEILELAETAAEKHLLETVNQEVHTLAEEGLFSYSSMVKTRRDAQGQVIYLEVDTNMLAKAKSVLVKRIDTALEGKKKIKFSIPLGSIWGWNLFSSFGFPITLRVFPIGMTKGEIYTVLEDCGINQTRHLIQINIETKLLVVLPKENTQVKTEVSLPLGERVLVGDVPEIYLDTIGAN